MQSVRGKLICFPWDKIKKYDKRYKLLASIRSCVPAGVCLFFIKAHLLRKPRDITLYEILRFHRDKTDDPFFLSVIMRIAIQSLSFCNKIV